MRTMEKEGLALSDTLRSCCCSGMSLMSLVPYAVLRSVYVGELSWQGGCPCQRLPIQSHRLDMPVACLAFGCIVCVTAHFLFLIRPS